MIRRAVDRIASLRLTISLLVSLAAVFLAGLVIPQKAALQRDLYDGWAGANPGLVRVLEAAGLTDIHGSLPVLALWGLFFANLLAAMWRRIPAIARRVAMSAPIAEAVAASFPNRKRIGSTSSQPLDRAARFFAERGCSVRSDAFTVYAVRNRLSPLATLGFHASFLLILAGAVTTTLTRFEGVVELGQGEEFGGGPEQRYASPPRVARWATIPSARFIVEGIQPEMVADVPVGLTVTLRDEQFWAQRMHINAPYRAPDGTSFVFKHLGVAPLLVLTAADEREVWGAWVRLDVLGSRPDHFPLLGRTITAQLFPDWVREEGEDGTRSREMRNPALRLSFDTATGPVRQLLRPGESAQLGPYVIQFRDWRYWVRLYVRSERGVALVFVGFGIAAASLVWRLLFFRREWVLWCRDGAPVEIAARADYYRATFADEFEREAAALEEVLNADDRGTLTPRREGA